ncbi:DUF4349 domain-containing protein [Streptomyces sp. 5-8]|uniref:DUF4349 domain-containing protein n=1 Tax=Streptomyces musisoli TaxID=2802280 RepID=A0ABS1NVE9_9ACTN|nr:MULTISPECIES: DUF4349 domain-containing protein [Streptomyces]MBL1103706.1 DUF4349 domain-containing protein [Streptomyces musisoli]MBY8843679.1 DUF4349 domain-containing protein [Streptomyces sp. SP2-10]
MRTPRSTRSARPVRALTGLLLAASLALAGCSGAGDSGGGSAKAASDADAAQAGAPGGTEHGKATRAAPRLTPDAIIRTASLTVEVEDVPKALRAARTTAEDAGGYVGSETTGRDADGHEHTRVVLRVPTGKYDEVLTGLQGTGRLVDRTAKAVDVTDQVVDVDSRIKSQRASVDRIRALMEKADKLSDVVALEGELSTRQADLEALLARQASLEDRTSLATITLSLSETPVRQADDSPGFTDALSGGWHVFVAMLRWIALALGAALPFAALAALLAVLWRRIVRPRLPRRPAPAPATTALGPLPSARPVPDPAAEAGEGGRD